MTVALGIDTMNQTAWGKPSAPCRGPMAPGMEVESHRDEFGALLSDLTVSMEEGVDDWGSPAQIEACAAAGVMAASMLVRSNAELPSTRPQPSADAVPRRPNAGGEEDTAIAGVTGVAGPAGTHRASESIHLSRAAWVPEGARSIPQSGSPLRPLPDAGGGGDVQAPGDGVQEARDDTRIAGGDIPAARQDIQTAEDPVWPVNASTARSVSRPKRTADSNGPGTTRAHDMDAELDARVDEAGMSLGERQVQPPDDRRPAAWASSTRAISSRNGDDPELETPRGQREQRSNGAEVRVSVPVSARSPEPGRVFALREEHSSTDTVRVQPQTESGAQAEPRVAVPPGSGKVAWPGASRQARGSVLNQPSAMRESPDAIQREAEGGASEGTTTGSAISDGPSEPPEPTERPERTELPKPSRRLESNEPSELSRPRAGSAPADQGRGSRVSENRAERTLLDGVSSRQRPEVAVRVATEAAARDAQPLTGEVIEPKTGSRTGSSARPQTGPWMQPGTEPRIEPAIEARRDLSRGALDLRDLLGRMTLDAGAGNNVTAGPRGLTPDSRRDSNEAWLETVLPGQGVTPEPVVDGTRVLDQPGAHAVSLEEDIEPSSGETERWLKLGASKTGGHSHDGTPEAGLPGRSETKPTAVRPGPENDQPSRNEYIGRQPVRSGNPPAGLTTRTVGAGRHNEPLAALPDAGLTQSPWSEAPLRRRQALEQAAARDSERPHILLSRDSRNEPEREFAKVGGEPSTKESGPGPDSTVDFWKTRTPSEPQKVSLDVRIEVTEPKPALGQGPEPAAGTLPDADGKAVISEIVTQARMRLSQDGGEFVVKLVPESLGEVEVKVKVAGDVCTTSFKVDNPEVRRFIQEHSTELVRAFTDQGMDLGGLNVSVGSQSERGRDWAQPFAHTPFPHDPVHTRGEVWRPRTAQLARTGRIDYIA
ncbi:MAG: flagellar hook-length control protein FliK [Firmicutes bacterium]|nr:flagellar hook-length control protein FliK [Bacillota bacterium]